MVHTAMPDLTTYSPTRECAQAFTLTHTHTHMLPICCFLPQTGIRKKRDAARDIEQEAEVFERKAQDLVASARSETLSKRFNTQSCAAQCPISQHTSPARDVQRHSPLPMLTNVFSLFFPGGHPQEARRRARH